MSHQSELARLAATPDDESLRLVHADALVARGDPRGELAQLQHMAAKEADPARAARLWSEADALIDAHRAELLGPLADAPSALVELAWRDGYVVNARVADAVDGTHAVADALAFVEALLASPSCALLQQLALGQLTALWGDYSALVAALSAAARHQTQPALSLRSLCIGDGIDAQRQRLEQLDFGAVVELANALPRLSALVLHGVGDDLALADLPPSLGRLALRCAVDGDGIAGRVAAADALRGALDELDLRGGTLGDAGAEALASARWPRALTLDLRDNVIGASGRQALAQLAESSRLRLAPQRPADDVSALRSVLVEPLTRRTSRRLRAARQLAQEYRYAEAIDAFELVLDEPHLTGFAERGARVDLVRALRDNGDVLRARQQLEQLLTFDRRADAPKRRAAANEIWTLLMLGLVDDDLGRPQSSAGHYAAALARLDTYAANDERESDEMRRLRAQALAGQAKALLSRGRPREAIAAYERVRALHADNDDTQLLAEADERIAASEQMMGNYAAAQARYEAALSGYREGGNRRAMAKALGNLATVYWHLGRWPDAEKTYREALDETRAVGDRRNEATVLANLCQGYMSRGRSDEAERYGVQAQALFEAIGHPAGAARVEHYLADVATMRGDLDLAAERMSRALATYRELGDERAEAQALATLGSLELDRDELEAARETHQRAVALYKRCADRYGENMARVGSAAAALGLGDHDAARAELERALAGSEALGNARGRVLCLAYLGLERLVGGDHAAALSFFERSLALCEEQESPHQAARTLAWQSAAYGAAGDHRAAKRAVAASAAALESLDDRQGGEQLAVARGLCALCADSDSARALTSARAAANAEYVALEARLLRALLRKRLAARRAVDS